MTEPLALQEALQPAFDRLVNEAEGNEVEVADALLALAVARVLALEANADVDARIAIARAVRSVEGLD